MYVNIRSIISEEWEKAEFRQLCVASRSVYIYRSIIASLRFPT